MPEIIDTHVHVYPKELQRDQEKISVNEPHFDLLTHNSVQKWGDADDLLRQMDADGISQSWICGFAFSDLGLCKFCNDYVIEAVRTHPDRFKGMAVVPPLARGALAELERCKAAGMIGVGELFTEEQLDIDDIEQTWRLAEACTDLHMFVLFHTAEPVGHDYDGKGNVGPREAAAFCTNHPACTVVFAHFGGGVWFYRTMPEMKLILSNAWFDTAAWPFLYDSSVIASARAVGALDRIMYGTDWPILTFGRFKNRIENAGLSEDEKTALLGGTARRLLASLR